MLRDRPACLSASCLLAVLVFLAWPACAGAALVPSGFNDDTIASGFDNPSNFDFLPDGRILVLEQITALVFVVDPSGVVPPDTVGQVPDVGPTGGENGLLGIAVDPRWPAKPYVYFHYNYALSPNLHVTRFALTGDLDGTGDGGLDLDVASKRDILADLPDDFPWHNGGTLLFAPDSMLFVGLGDDNVPCSAQDIHQLRGKLLRLSVLGVPDGPGSAPDYQAITPPDNPFGNPDPRTRLVWAYGLRNPWSFDIDPTTGTVAIADVGNDAYEEIDLVTEGAKNFGWPLYEGPWRFNYALCTYSDTLTLTPPSFWYAHGKGPSAVMMGGIAHWNANALANFPPDYMGDVFYAELYTSKLYRLDCAGGTCTPAPPAPGQPDSAAWATGLDNPTRLRFGPDAGLWYVNGAGQLKRIRADLALAVDPRVDGSGAVQLRAFPVPSMAGVRMSFRLPAPGPATVFISDARGRRVRTLVSEPALPAGEHAAAWDGADDHGARVAPGVYFGTVRSAERSASRRVVLLGAR